MDRVNGPESLAGDLGVRHADSEGFFHTDYELKGIDGIKSEAAGAEKRQIVRDLIRGSLEHQIFDEHFLDLVAEIRLGHKAGCRSSCNGGRSQPCVLNEAARKFSPVFFGTPRAFFGDGGTGQPTPEGCYRGRPAHDPRPTEGPWAVRLQFEESSPAANEPPDSRRPRRSFRRCAAHR
jgi:hypothetical protein